MKLKKPALFAIIGIVLVAIAATAYFLFFSKKEAKKSESASKRQIINALPFKDRPFVAIFPHETNKLITMMVDKKPDSDISVDIEYLSGNALKGGRTTVLASAPSPYTQAFLLGSCSAGGKCSFDKDITTGTIKTKLELNSELHLLKSNYAFVSGDSATSDQKLKFAPTGKSTAQLIIGQTHGFTGTLEQEVVAEPVVITSTKNDKVTGTLTLHAPQATKLMIFDGTAYKELIATKEGDYFTVSINQTPWSKKVTIIRDDLKGAEEEAELDLVGPIVPVK